ncbi:hypothetical protein Tco_0041553, partial [Tanacetum coccineum]
LSDIGSPGVDGPPVMPEDLYAYVVAAFQAPSSLDYVPGLEEPEQAPPLPEFVPEPIYPEFMPPEDDVLPAEEQPLPAVVLPTANSPGYIPESDPEEDPEEDDDEDLEEDPADYPIDRDDDEEDPKEDPADYPTDRDEEEEEEEPSSDKVDDEVEDEDDEEEEHPAPADSISPPVHHVTARISIRAQTPVSLPSNIEVARLFAIPTPPPSPLFPWSSPLPRIPSPPLPVSPHLPVSPPPLPVSPTYPLRYKAAMIRLRAETPSTSHQLPSSRAGVCRVGVSEVTLPPQKRLCIALGLRYEVGESSSAPTTTPTGGLRADYGFVGTLDDEIRRDLERDVGYGITNT